MGFIIVIFLICVYLIIYIIPQQWWDKCKRAGESMTSVFNNFCSSAQNFFQTMRTIFVEVYEVFMFPFRDLKNFITELVSSKMKEKKIEREKQRENDAELAVKSFDAWQKVVDGDEKNGKRDVHILSHKYGDKKVRKHLKKVKSYDDE